MTKPTLSPEHAAMLVLDNHMAALNSRDEKALAETLHFPHYRLSAEGMRTWDSPDSYFKDFRARAGDGWHHSKWDFRAIIASGEHKVHLDVQFTRYRPDNTSLGSFRSLWVITYAQGNWAAALRSSFAK
ncbi:MAG TPA: hypothetical protein VMX97_11610 [Hyphomicrobiaceae bacterium]|nr:hypothetical protein [Hyphomicrobiaceae bacterium]